MQGRDDIARIASARAVEIASRAISLASSVKGEKGDKGEPGEIVLKNVPVPGEKGEQGEKGERGYTGAQGEKGDKGDKGDRGTDAVGAKGDKGDKGDTGPQGERGFVGPRGFKGDEGERGLTGPIPKHEIKGLKFRFQQDDGDWGKWIIVPTGGGGGGRDDKLFDRQKELMEIADAYKSNTNPFPVVYPPAGIPNSTGSAWGTSYGVTGTGSVVLNSNPTFATDITVNGLKVGRGDGNIASNTAFGVDALGSPAITASNINNVAIGYNALNDVDTGVATITITNGGSGYNDDGNDNFIYTATCTFVSGTPATVYPTVILQVVGGEIIGVTVTNKGYGFTNGSPTVMTVPDFAGYGGSGAVFNIATYAVASNNTAVGYEAGNGNRTGSGSVYIGANANGVGTNEIAIGGPGNGDNTVTLGNSSTTATYLKGMVSSNNINGGGIFYWYVGSAPDSFIVDGSTPGGSIIMGGETSNAPMTFGRSTNAQTINISSASSTSNKTINIGRNGTSGSASINIGSISGGGTICAIGGGSGTNTANIGNTTGTATIGIATGATTGTKTVNIGTSTSSGTTSIAIGSVGGTSTTTINGAVLLSATSQALSLGTNQTTGTINIGGAGSATGAITIGLSTGTQTVNIATGVNTGTKTLNLGTGASTGATNITIGSTAGTSATTLNGNIILSKTATPASATATGTAGTIVWDANYIYICTATNTWKRVAISTW